MKRNSLLTIAAFSVALAATVLAKANKSALLLTAYGDNTSVAGMCNPGIMPINCTTTPTVFGICTVTFSNGTTDQARVAGCAAFYYKTN